MLRCLEGYGTTNRKTATSERWNFPVKLIADPQSSGCDVQVSLWCLSASTVVLCNFRTFHVSQQYALWTIGTSCRLITSLVLCPKGQGDCSTLPLGFRFDAKWFATLRLFAWMDSSRTVSLTSF